MTRIGKSALYLATAVSVVPGFIVGLPALAQAQTQSESATTGKSASAEGLGDIVVTARKRNESLLDVPISISALSGEDMAARGIKDLASLTDFAPGLRFENQAANRNDRSFQTLTMRGLYPGDFPNRQAATVFLDGVPLPGGAIAGLTGVERVEVVKGPQSAYFGRATFAGAVNFITSAPSLTEFKGQGTVSYASYGETDDNLSLEGPIIKDKLAVRLSGRYYHTDGQYQNAGYSGRLGERETRSFAVSVIAKPVENMTLRGFFTFWKDNDGPSAQSALNEKAYNCNVGGTARTVGGLNDICGAISSAPAQYISQNLNPNGRTDLTNMTSLQTVNSPDFLDGLGLRRDAYQAYISGSYDLGRILLTGSVSNAHNRWGILTDTYNRGPDGTGFYSTVLIPEDHYNTSAELRAASTGHGPFQFSLGGNYYWESVWSEALAYRGGTVTPLSRPNDVRARTFGIFGSASYSITSRLTLSGEARYQWDTIRAINPFSNFDQSATFRSFTPRVILNYKFIPSASIYASYSEGTRPGSFNNGVTAFSDYIRTQLDKNAPSPILTSVPEEKLRSYEVGLKGDFLNRRVRVLAAAYYGEWLNRQINQSVAYYATPAALAANIVSSTTLAFPNGRTNLWGLELETTIKPARYLTIDGTFNWAHTDVRFTSCSECAQENGQTNPVGNSMERYPEFSGTAGVGYNRPISGEVNGFARVDYIYTGIQYATEANVAHLAPSHRINTSVGIERGDIRIEVFTRNLFDSKVPSNILRSNNPNGAASQGINLLIVAPADRRTIGLRLSTKF
jgi:iron complex outermembrane receptor protein